MFLLLYNKKNISNAIFEKTDLLGVSKLNIYVYLFSFINFFQSQIIYKCLRNTLRQYIHIYTYFLQYKPFKQLFSSILNNTNIQFNFLISNYIESRKPVLFNNNKLFLVMLSPKLSVYFIKKLNSNILIYKKYRCFNLKKRFAFYSDIYDSIGFISQYMYTSFYRVYNTPVNLIYNNFCTYNKNLVDYRVNKLNPFFVEYNNNNNMLFLTQNSNYDFKLFKFYTTYYNFKYNNLFGVYLKSFFFFEIFLKKFFEVKYKQNIYMLFSKSNITYLSNNVYYLSLVKRLKKLQIFSKQSNLVKEIIEILTLTFYTHDIILLKNWLVNVSEKLHFKSHKKLFYILKVIIVKYFNLYFKYFGCLGFCLKINGKIGLGGSSKTKNFWIKVGKFSLSKKNLRIAYTSGCMRTYSGILGAEFILSYI